MDLFSNADWDVLFGYVVHDGSCLVLMAAAALTALVTASRLWMEHDRRA